MTQDQIEAAMVRVAGHDPMETIWRMNIDALAAGAYGDTRNPATLVRYWSDQADAGFPGAEENLKYFVKLAEKTRPQTRPQTAAEIFQQFLELEEQQKKGKTTP